FLVQFMMLIVSALSINRRCSPEVSLPELCDVVRHVVCSSDINIASDDFLIRKRLDSRFIVNQILSIPGVTTMYRICFFQNFEDVGFIDFLFIRENLLPSYAVKIYVHFASPVFSTYRL